MDSQNVGFIVYGCTYGGDARWARLMTRLNTYKDHILPELYHKPDLADSLDWSVQEDSSVDGATGDETRRRFRAWVSFKAEIPIALDGFKASFFCVRIRARNTALLMLVRMQWSL